MKAKGWILLKWQPFPCPHQIRGHPISPQYNSTALQISRSVQLAARPPYHSLIELTKTIQMAQEWRQKDEYSRNDGRNGLGNKRRVLLIFGVFQLNYCVQCVLLGGGLSTSSLNFGILNFWDQQFLAQILIIGMIFLYILHKSFLKWETVLKLCA